MIESGTIERALLLVDDSETNHQVTDDTSFTMMFGDAGSATLLERGEGSIKGMIRSDGKGFNTLITPIPVARFPGIYTGMTVDGSEKLEKKMEGNDVFLFTITKILKLFKEFYGFFGTSGDDFYPEMKEAGYILLARMRRLVSRDITEAVNKLPPPKKIVRG